MVDLTAPLTELVAALERGDVSARELLDLHLDRIEQLDGPINSVVTLEPERARAEASAIDDARAGGRTVGPLGGVPITVKDAIATAGIRSTGGAVELRDHVPTADATVVDTVQRAGAVVFGKTNVRAGRATTRATTRLFGTTNNPWDLDARPGGSSGGPAAAVAMGFTGSRSAPTSADRSASRRRSAVCSATSRASASSRRYGYLDNPAFHRNVADVNVFGPIARVDRRSRTAARPAGGAEPGRCRRVADRSAAGAGHGARRTSGSRRGSTTSSAGSTPRCSTCSRRPWMRWSAPGPASIANSDRTSTPTPLPSREPDHRRGVCISDTDEEHAASVAAGIRARPSSVGRPPPRTRHHPPAVVGVLHGRRHPALPGAPVPPFRHVHSSAGPNWLHATLADHDDRPYLDLVRWSALTGSAYLPVTVPPVGRTASGLPGRDPGGRPVPPRPDRVGVRAAASATSSAVTSLPPRLAPSCR